MTAVIDFPEDWGCWPYPSSFDRVLTYAYDETGKVKAHMRTDPVTQRQTILEKRWYVHEIQSGDLYWPDPMYVVAAKCALIVIAAPLYTAINMLWDGIKFPVQMVEIAGEGLAAGLDALCQKKYEEAVLQIAAIFWEVLGKGVEGSWNVFCSPFYGVAMLVSALYGIIHPYAGRKYVGRIEKSWHHGVPYSVALDPKNGYLFYLASCFQVRGNLKSQPARFQVLSTTSSTSSGARARTSS